MQEVMRLLPNSYPA